MNNTKRYFGYLSEILKQTFADEEKAIIKAAELVTKSILEGGNSILLVQDILIL